MGRVMLGRLKWISLLVKLQAQAPEIKLYVRREAVNMAERRASGETSKNRGLEAGV